jgi:hypothetical protein
MSGTLEQPTPWHPARVGHDLPAADRVELLATFRAALLGDGVRAVEGVVERAPAGVGGVEGIARVRDRHHELRARDAGDLVVDVGGADREVRRLGNEVADVAQEALVSGAVEGLAGAGAVVVVDPLLELVAALEQGAVARREVAHEA